MAMCVRPEASFKGAAMRPERNATIYDRAAFVAGLTKANLVIYGERLACGKLG